MKLAEIIQRLEAIAPTKLAESWDNVGLLAGDPESRVRSVLLTIDLTAAVLREAKAARCELVIAYHPPIFEPLKRLSAKSLVYQAIRASIAIYSPHTALDVADGGTNDMLADVVGMTDCLPLSPASLAAVEFKLVTFVPAESVERVSGALFKAGAGRIGDYSSCSFRMAGTGTFFGEAGTNPKVGRRGRLESVNEIRLEMVAPTARLGEIINALRKAHPYEEPAFDLVQLAARPSARGMGRVGSVDGASRSKLLTRIKRGLGVKHLLVSGPTDGIVKKAAVCAGSCGGLLNDAIAAGAELFLTGEVRHHDALKAAAAGMTVVCALHSNSERPVLAILKNRLAAGAVGLKIAISRADRDPFQIL